MTRHRWLVHKISVPFTTYAHCCATRAKHVNVVGSDGGGRGDHVGSGHGGDGCGSVVVVVIWR
jgi:hypothetical protein